MAACILDKTGAQPRRMFIPDYLAAVRARPHGPDPGRITEAPWDPHLATALRDHGVAVAEERVIDVLLGDLASPAVR